MESSFSGQDQGMVNAHLNRFDELDFQAFSRHDWDLFNQIHTADVLVTFPDGHQTRGIRQHDQDMQAMFAWAPDMKVVSHPIKFGAGERTAVTGVLSGTFTRPMVFSDGTMITPTNKSFSIPMCTIASWQGDQISEETLFWDTAAMMEQMGVSGIEPGFGWMREDF
jgi:ketosteroid isomerase-like protein